MIQLLQRLRRRLPADDGISMIEVIVALMIFMFIAVGMAGALVTMQRIAHDTKFRDVAANLAIAEIERLRAQPDPLRLTSTPPNTPDEIVVGATTYRVEREIAWGSTTGNVARCGTEGGNLQFKRVALRVTWDGMTMLRSAVKMDTIIAPRDRVNDPAFGTIAIAVRGWDGLGRRDVAISIRNTATGATLPNVAATDADGCALAIAVPPGTYRITPSRTNYITSGQILSGSTPGPAVERTVTAGTTAAAEFDFDQRATLTLRYASNAPNPPRLPNGMTTTLFGKDGPVRKTDSGGPTSSRSVFPFNEGYTGVAGNYQATTETTVSCESVDPLAWGEGAVGSLVKAAGQRSPVASTTPGGSSTLLIPMGLARVNVPDTPTIYARTANPTSVTYPGDPGCRAGMTYAIPVSRNATQTVALPYGSWEFATAASFDSSSRLAANRLAVDPLGGGVGPSGIVTLDPRAVK